MDPARTGLGAPISSYLKVMTGICKSCAEKERKMARKTKYQEYPCDLCGSQDAVEVPHVLFYNNGLVHICRRCGFVYVKQRRSAAEIARTWSEELYGEGYTAFIPAVKARQTYVADFIHANIGLRGKELCDIGTGQGQFLDIVRKKEYGAKVFGTEDSKAHCAKMAAAGINHFQGTIEKFQASRLARQYRADIVTIMWTLENCRSCRDMLSAAHDILKKNGSIVVATGSRILVPFKKPLHLYFSRNPADTHSFRFSANTLRGILAVSGFEVTHANSYLDRDILCMIARKKDISQKIPWQGDDFLQVSDFFDRWHRENVHYRT
jgi:2-polyprenyl-3-methyl-5-hydroxy-6-metoxy-1,4-benzoquinol methylase